MNSGMVAVARATIGGVGRKCVETCDGSDGAVEFTYPSEYVDGMELSCCITVNPSFGTHVVLFKMDKKVNEFVFDNGRNRSEKMANLLGALERFEEFCVKSDDDVAFTRLLTSRMGHGKPRASKQAPRVFLA